MHKAWTAKYTPAWRAFQPVLGAGQTNRPRAHAPLGV